jgi:hypothetical protein
MFITGIWALSIVLSPQAHVTAQTCNASHLSRSDALERKCGMLQDEFKLEYICKNTKPNALCWVEKNDRL